MNTRYYTSEVDTGREGAMVAISPPSHRQRQSLPPQHVRKKKKNYVARSRVILKHDYPCLCAKMIGVISMNFYVGHTDSYSIG